jgi:hypothetical protein
MRQRQRFPKMTASPRARDVQEVQEQLATLRQALADQQRRIAEQDLKIAQQQEELANLRNESVAPERPLAATARPGRRGNSGGITRRRALLRLGGASAAASVVAVAGGLTGAQTAHAAPAGAGDGTTVIQGAANVNTSQTGTILNAAASSSPVALLTSDNSASSSPDVNNTSGVTAVGPIGTTGVIGVANGGGGYGVWGQTSAGFAVVGNSGTGIDLAAFGTGRVIQGLQPFAGAPASGFYLAGEMIRDSNGELWLCTAGDGSTVGTWVKVAHLSPGATSGGATTYLSKSIRLLDTRVGFSALNTPNAPYAGGSTHALTIACVTYNGVTVPSNCIGAIGNLTAVSTPAGGGYLALVPHGLGFSGTANLAYGPNQIVGNFFSVVLSGGQVDIIVGGNTTDVVFDLFAVVS